MIQYKTCLYFAKLLLNPLVRISFQPEPYALSSDELAWLQTQWQLFNRDRL